MSNAERAQLLVVSPTFPYPPVSGGKQRIYFILSELAREHDITLLTLAEPGDACAKSAHALSFLARVITVPISQQRWQQLCRFVTNAPRWLLGTPAEVLVKRSPKLLCALKRLLATGEFDAVQLEYSQFISLLDPAVCNALPTIVVAHDVSFVSQQRKAHYSVGIMRWFWQREARLMERFEVKGWRKATRVIAMSQLDRKHILERVPRACVDVIPNGVDVQALYKFPKSYKPTLVFVGWMRHLPNKDAIAWFLRDIWPDIRAGNDSVRFLIVGAGLNSRLRSLFHTDNRVDYLGLVDDVGPVVGSAWISVAPIRIGSGSRLKILQSMALGTPVVSTRVGCEGIAVEPDRHILIEDRPASFARVVIDLLNAPAKRRKQAIEARCLVEAKYAWRQIGILARASLVDVCKTRRQARPPSAEPD